MSEVFYNIGLDLGTSSIGWACTGESNDIIKVKGKNLWGVRLFDEAESKKTTRLYRSTQRRYLRRRNRLNFLNTFVKEDMDKIDCEFFNKLDNSFRVRSDREALPWSVQFFKSKKEYNELIKKNTDENGNPYSLNTIYHIRKQCMENKQVDFRLVYMSLHHLIKYRGNFLYEGQAFDLQSFDVEEKVCELFAFLDEKFEIKTTKENIAKITEIIKADKKDNRIYYTSTKQKDIVALFSADKKTKKQLDATTKLFLGQKATLSDLFEFLADSDVAKVSFGAGFEESESSLQQALGGDYVFIEKAKQIYSYVTLSKILNGKNSISDAMLEKYEAHKQDLADLKKLLRNKNYFSQEEKLLALKFPVRCPEGTKKDADIASYYLYIKKPGKVPVDSFYKYISNLLKSKENLIAQNEEDYNVYNRILSRISSGEFMPRQTSTENGEIPMQLHREELEKILNSQGKYYKTLSENKNKILKLFDFRIPYFVGPLHTKSRFSWIQKVNNSTEPITPFNFDEIVDKEASAEEFIIRMLNHCEYLPNEKCMAKESLTCQFYEVLQEVNGLRINGKKIGKDLKQKIVKELFMKNAKVTIRSLQNYLVKECKGYYLGSDTIDENNLPKIDGIADKEKFNSSLSTYYFLTSKLGLSSDFIVQNREKLDKMIRELTIFKEGEVRNVRMRRYYSLLGEENAKQITKKAFSGWSRLSKRLVDGIRHAGTNMTILEHLWEDEKDNFLMNYVTCEGFKNTIEKEYKKYLEENETSLKDLIDKSYCSPMVKRTIWQTMLIIDEIVSIIGNEPNRIYVEFAGEEDEGKENNSRKRQLEKLYEKIMQEVDSVEFKEAYNSLKMKDKINTDMIYLYYMQNGKSMYSGLSLGDINQLSQNCEIDHIIPRSLIVDNSFDNRVLVLKSENQEKRNEPLSAEIRNKMQSFWNMLNKYGLCSNKKLRNLNVAKFTDKEIMGFVNRQLVVTRQATREVMNILKTKFEDKIVNGKIQKRVVAVNAKLSSLYREKFGLYKSRIVNDCHHAHDAYIAAVIGQYMNKQFPHLDDTIYYSHKTKLLKDSFLANINKKDEKGNSRYGAVISHLHKQILDSDGNGEVIWNPDTNILVKENIFGDGSEQNKYGKKVFVTKMAQKEISGQLYKITILPKEADIRPVNKERNNTALYGGFKTMEIACFAIVDYSKENKGRTKHIYEIERVDKIDIIDAKTKNMSLNDYLLTYRYNDNKNGAPKIISFINKWHLLEVNGHPIYKVGGRVVYNAKQCKLSYAGHKTLAYIKGDKIHYNIIANGNNDITTEKCEEILENNLKELFDEVKEIYKKQYEYLLGFNCDVLDNFDFDKLPLKASDNIDKIHLTNALFTYFCSGYRGAYFSMTDFGLSSKWGLLSPFTRPSKQETYIINRSITGFYQQRIKIGE